MDQKSFSWKFDIDIEHQTFLCMSKFHEYDRDEKQDKMSNIDHLFRDDDSKGLCFIIYDYLEKDDIKTNKYS